MTTPREHRFAIVLGGGRSSRMGSDKLALELDGSPLLSRTCRAASDFAGGIVVAGPEKSFLRDAVWHPEEAERRTAHGAAQGEAHRTENGAEHRTAPAPRLEFAVEDPPFGGPSAGIAAALTRLPREGECLVLAGDLARPARVVMLLSTPEADAALAPRSAGRSRAFDAVVPLDSGGRPQYLAGRYRLEALHDAVAAAGTTRDLSVRRLLGTLRTTGIEAPDSTTHDIDTPDDAQKIGIRGKRF